MDAECPIDLGTLKDTVLIIEGGIAVGKTTFCERIEKQLTSMRIPVKIFFEEFPPGWLEYYYENQLDHGATFQVLAVHLAKMREHAADEWLQHNPGGIAVLDRGVLSTLVFISFMMRMGILQPDVYMLLNDLVTRDIKSKTYTIRIDSTAEECLRRCQYRARKGEQAITLEYLTTLNAEYTSLLKPDLILESAHISKKWLNI